MESRVAARHDQFDDHVADNEDSVSDLWPRDEEHVAVRWCPGHVRREPGRKFTGDHGCSMSRRTIARVRRWPQSGRPRGNVEPGFIAPHRLKGVIGAPKPGWYPDPAGAPGLYRWWDGGNWAQVTSDSAQAPPPIPLLSEAPSGGAASLRRASPLRVAAVLSVGFALFLSASIGIGLVLWQDTSDSSAQGPLGGAAGRSSPAGVGTAPVGHLDERTRTATDRKSTRLNSSH